MSTPYFQGSLTMPQRFHFLKFILLGALFSLGFAPFHLSGLLIIGLALFFHWINRGSIKESFLSGFLLGLGFFGSSVSWVYVSIHTYGGLNPLLSALITLLFIAYLSLYPLLAAGLYRFLSNHCGLFFSCLLFAALWVLSEWVRASLFGGFPWVLLGFGQTETPLRYLLPLIGVYGVSFATCFSASVLTASFYVSGIKRLLGLTLFVFIILGPLALKNHVYTESSGPEKAVSVIQTNLSMRNQWDESIFYTLLSQYKTAFESLNERDRVIIMPESAFPLPKEYLKDYFDDMDKNAHDKGSVVLLGLPEKSGDSGSHYYNTLMSLGDASGSYHKQHLVPFGEFIPAPFQHIIDWLGVPISNLTPGEKTQALIKVKTDAIATLICYELAYPALLRKQLPEASFIVSISDDGWFGHSFAIYQQLQMAQTLSLQTARFQVVANNDGLSSLINAQGTLIKSLPAFQSGTLSGDIEPLSGETPWVHYGDKPALEGSGLLLALAVLRKRRYSYPLRKF